MKIYKTLCQDCLRVKPFEKWSDVQLAFSGETRCVCGGELCHCGSCNQTIKALESGELGMVEGCTVEITAWTAEGGATCKP